MSRSIDPKQRFLDDGFVIFENLIPIPLLAELRELSKKYRKRARKMYGAQTQRLQPLHKYSDENDQKLCAQFIELPAIRDAVELTLSSGHSISWKYLGMMFTPKYLPYCMPWHRDWRDNCEGLDLKAWHDVHLDLDFFNQINCPIFEDQSLWVVPGSHRRDDTLEEQELFPTRPIVAPYNGFERIEGRLSRFRNYFDRVNGKASLEREMSCLDYCRMMPNAQQVVLKPGDLLLYRNSIWHTGNYVPHQTRATFHTTVMTDRYQDWISEQKTKLAAKRAEGSLKWENPNKAGLQPEKQIEQKYSPA